MPKPQPAKPVAKKAAPAPAPKASAAKVTKPKTAAKAPAPAKAAAPKKEEKGPVAKIVDVVKKIVTPKTAKKAQPEAAPAKAPAAAAKPAPAAPKPAPKAKAEPAAALPVEVVVQPRKVDAKTAAFNEVQRGRLLQLRDDILDSMNGVAKDTLRSRAEGSEASAFGMHQADAGSDAYDRDFALSLLSQEQDALYEIEEALKRIESGTYGFCEMSGKAIAQARLEALPFARYTVECQAQLEKQTKIQRTRTPVTSLFGLTDSEEAAENDEEETPAETKE